MAENTSNQVRKSPWMNLGVYVSLFALAIIGFITLPNATEQILAAILFLAFGLVYTFLFARADNTRAFVVYFVIQTLIASALLPLFRDNDVLNLLFFILGVQVMLIFRVRVALTWILLFYLITVVYAFGRLGLNGAVSILFNAAVFAFTAMYGYTLRQVEIARRENQKLLQELRDAQTQRQELTVTQERNRLARDLHDSVKQQIFAASMQVGATRASLDNPMMAREHLDETERLMHQAQQELNTLIFELRPIGLGEQGLANALRAYLGTWSRASTIRSEMNVEGTRTLPPEIEQAFFRVAQESLANIARHSAAAHVAIELNYAPTGTRMSITDNGRGFQVTENFKGIGLDSMRERMIAVGGNLEIASELEHGTRVTATLPERTTQ